MIVIGLAERIGNVRTKARELDTCISLRKAHQFYLSSFLMMMLEPLISSEHIIANS